MPKRPPTSGYARIAQFEDDEDDVRFSNESDDPFNGPAVTLSTPGTEYAPIQPKRWTSSMRFPDSSGSTPRRPRRTRANSGVDIKAINARLERWAEEIKDRFTRRRVKGKSADEERLEIHQSVFQAPEWIRPATKEALEADYEEAAGRMSKMEFDDLIEAVRTAIELGVHPTLISQGSSGSYFARNSGGKVLGVFKPKDEEPYANKNPKWTKWLHRNLLPFAFGRAMLIPNLSYVSEAAAYVLDCQLRTNLVPYTDVVGLSSKSFHYDWMDRRAYYRKKRPFPEKLGSFQVFLKGFKGATDFFQEHPWPDQQSGLRDTRTHSRKRSRWDDTCRPKSAGPEAEESEEEGSGLVAGQDGHSREEFWSPELQQNFREELEKLVILDYVMRNTDRGTDNWMIRIDRETQKATVVSEPIRRSEVGEADKGYHRREESMTPQPPQFNGDTAIPHIGAIDNSLSWPWKHPDAWRSYPFGWLFLPVSLIGRPFSEKTRKHFLPLLTSKEWWSETSVKLRRCFEIDADFQEKMFARQMAVMKGQAWNVVEALKASDHGPLELTRRSRVMVWDDIVEIPVAVPLPRASEEMRSRAAGTQIAAALDQPLRKGIEEEEEMDISAALSGSAPTPHMPSLSLSTPSQRDHNPFNHSRHNSSQDVNAPTTPGQSGDASKSSPGRPGARRSRTSASRMSHDLPRGVWQTPPSERRRRFSLALGRQLSSNPVDDGLLDEEGDLGYAAAATQENSMRKVIVERLEVVKSKQPFFSWC